MAYRDRVLSTHGAIHLVRLCWGNQNLCPPITYFTLKSHLGGLYDRIRKQDWCIDVAEWWRETRPGYHAGDSHDARHTCAAILRYIQQQYDMADEYAEEQTRGDDHLTAHLAQYLIPHRCLRRVTAVRWDDESDSDMIDRLYMAVKDLVEFAIEMRCLKEICSVLEVFLLTHGEKIASFCTSSDRRLWLELCRELGCRPKTLQKLDRLFTSTNVAEIDRELAALHMRRHHALQRHLVDGELGNRHLRCSHHEQNHGRLLGHPHVRRSVLEFMASDEPRHRPHRHMVGMDSRGMRIRIPLSTHRLNILAEDSMWSDNSPSVSEDFGDSDGGLDPPRRRMGPRGL